MAQLAVRSQQDSFEDLRGGGKCGEAAGLSGAWARVKSAIRQAHSAGNRLNQCEVEATESVVASIAEAIRNDRHRLEDHWTNASKELRLIQEKVVSTINDDTLRFLCNERRIEDRSSDRRPSSLFPSESRPNGPSSSTNIASTHPSISSIHSDIMSFFGLPNPATNEPQTGVEEPRPRESVGSFGRSSEFPDNSATPHALSLASLLTAEVAFDMSSLKGFLNSLAEGDKVHKAIRRTSKAVNRLLVKSTNVPRRHVSEQTQVFVEDAHNALSRLEKAINEVYWPALLESANPSELPESQPTWIAMITYFMSTAAHYAALNSYTYGGTFHDLLLAEKRAMRTEWNLLVTEAHCDSCHKCVASFEWRCCQARICRRCLHQMVSQSAQRNEKLENCIWCSKQRVKWLKHFYPRPILGEFASIIMKRANIYSSIKPSLNGEISANLQENPRNKMEEHGEAFLTSLLKDALEEL